MHVSDVGQISASTILLPGTREEQHHGRRLLLSLHMSVIRIWPKHYTTLDKIFIKLAQVGTRNLGLQKQRVPREENFVELCPLNFSSITAAAPGFCLLYLFTGSLTLINMMMWFSFTHLKEEAVHRRETAPHLLCVFSPCLWHILHIQTNVVKRCYVVQTTVCRLFFSYIFAENREHVAVETGENLWMTQHSSYTGHEHDEHFSGALSERHNLMEAEEEKRAVALHTRPVCPAC